MPADHGKKVALRRTHVAGDEVFVGVAEPGGLRRPAAEEEHVTLGQKVPAAVAEGAVPRVDTRATGPDHRRFVSPNRLDQTPEYFPGLSCTVRHRVGDVLHPEQLPGVHLTGAPVVPR